MCCNPFLSDSIVTARKRSLGQGNIFTPVCHSVHRVGVRGCRGRGHVWLPGGMHGCQGACVVAGEGMHGCQGAYIGYDKIWSMSRWYSSY